MIDQSDYEELKSTILKETQDRNVFYLPNPGNWGDSLIRHGTKLFFSDIELNYTELTTNKADWIVPFIKGGIVIYGGGGAWCSNWQNSYVKKLSKRFRVIVLPSTYENKQYIDNVIFFSRDKFQSLVNVSGSIFTHDMAFYIYKQLLNKNKGVGSGFFFREDKESACVIKIPNTNYDISHKGNHLTPVDGFFNKLNAYEKIYTDRLHVAIAAALLEKTVHFYPGNYFKSESIFNSSFKGYFENVFFHKNFDIDF